MPITLSVRGETFCLVKGFPTPFSKMRLKDKASCGVRAARQGSALTTRRLL